MAATFTAVMGFQPPSTVRSSKTALSVAVDPTVVTKKDYEDICGVSFDDDALVGRLKATNYLYPKHVEVIEDIAPIAGEMVDDVVSSQECCRWISRKTLQSLDGSRDRSFLLCFD